MAAELELDERLADIEHAALYCFDVLLARLLGKTEAVPLRFPEAECGVYIQWRKYKSADRKKSTGKPKPVGANMVQLTPVSLRSQLSAMVEKTLLGTKKREPITLNDVPCLECTLTTVEPGSLRAMARDEQDWVQGRDGLVVSFEAENGEGKLQRKATVFFPDFIEYHGWTLSEAVVKGIAMKCPGEPTREMVDSIRLQRFSTERVAVFFSDYAAEREGEDLLSELQSKLRPASGALDKLQKEKREQTSFFFQFAAGILVIAALMVYLRYSQLTYSVDYDQFLDNYSILGVEEGADLKTVKSAFRKLSRQWHPDKNPGCADCPEKYRVIAEAHKQISDYEKGVLKFSTNVPLNSRFRPR